MDSLPKLVDDVIHELKVVKTFTMAMMVTSSATIGTSTMVVVEISMI